MAWESCSCCWLSSCPFQVRSGSYSSVTHAAALPVALCMSALLGATHAAGVVACPCRLPQFPFLSLGHPMGRKGTHKQNSLLWLMGREAMNTCMRGFAQ